MQNNTRTLTASGGVVKSAEPSGPASWQLAAGHFVSTDTTGLLPNIIYPRPDGETSTDARHRWAYPGVKYEIPIVVQGGSYPFKYEITSTAGTSATIGNATIGETLTVSGDQQIRPANYGVIEWTPGAGEDTDTFTINVRVTDQDGNTDTVQINGTVQTSKFIFYNQSWGGTQSGTIAEPYSAWQTAFGTESTPVNADKICYFRDAADNILTGYAGNNGNYTTLNRCLSYVGYPGESPRINLGTGFFNCSNTDDLFFGGIDFHDNDQTVDKGRMFSCQPQGWRMTWWRNTFTNYHTGVGTSNNNQAIIYYSNVRSIKAYQAIVSNTLTGTTNTTFQLYGFYYGVVEDNTYTSAETMLDLIPAAGHLINFKDSPRFASMRANTAVDIDYTANAGPTTFASMNQNGASDVEICWNKGFHSNDNTVDLCVSYGGDLSEYGALHIYRNSMLGDITSTNVRSPDSGCLIGNVVTDTLPGIMNGTPKQTGTAVAGTSTTIELESDPGNCIGMSVTITGGTGAGQVRRVESKSGAVLTVSTDFDTAPDNTSTYTLGLVNWTTEENMADAGALDSNANLTGSARTDHLGTRGAEVA